MENTTAMRTLVRSWKPIVALGLVGALIGLLLGMTGTKQYRSSSELFLSVQSAETTGDIAQTSQYAQDQATNFATMATSEKVLQPTIKELGLGESVTDLAKKVSADVPLKSSAVQVSVTYPDAAKAAAIANTVAKHLSELVAEFSPKVGGKTSPVTMVQVDSATPATSPSSPSVPLYLIGGLVLGTLAGCALALLRAARGAPHRDRPARAAERS